MTTTFVILNRKYSSRIRKIIGGKSRLPYRLMGAHIDSSSLLCVWWLVGRQARTDKFMRRILALGMGKIEES